MLVSVCFAEINHYSPHVEVGRYQRDINGVVEDIFGAEARHEGTQLGPFDVLIEVTHMA